MLCGNVNVSSLHGALEQRPVAFQRVHMVLAANVFLPRVIDGVMVVGVAKTMVGPMFVRADR